MSTIIDRRLNPRDKTIKNRQRFIQRSKDQIKEVVKKTIDEGNIADIQNNKIRVRAKGIGEPQFQVDPKTGDKKYVMPGNKEYIEGDTEDKPPKGGGRRGTKGGVGVDAEDEFEFVLSKDEFMDFIFEDLELPDLVKKQIKDVTKTQLKRAGYTNTGNPSQLDVVRSLKNSMGRRIGLHRPKNEEIEELEKKIDQAIIDKEVELVQELKIHLDELKRKQVAIPWLDPFDVRYRNFTHVPKPTTKAVMFCLMDVSASMGQREKDLAKRFFFLLHMFLHRKYEKVDIIFIRHHEEADEVDEEEFFYGQVSGGTVVSSALKLTKEIIHKRYPTNDWNIYIAQSSDGDNYSDDSAEATKCVTELMPLTQYFAYIEIGKVYQLGSEANTDLWDSYSPVADEFKHLAMRTVFFTEDIWKVFKSLFARESA